MQMMCNAPSLVRPIERVQLYTSGHSARSRPLNLKYNIHTLPLRLLRYTQAWLGWLLKVSRCVSMYVVSKKLIGLWFQKLNLQRLTREVKYKHDLLCSYSTSNHFMIIKIGKMLLKVIIVLDGYKFNFQNPNTVKYLIGFVSTCYIWVWSVW